MLSDSTIFIIGLCVSALCVAFVVASALGLCESGRDGHEAHRARHPGRDDGVVTPRASSRPTCSGWPERRGGAP
jgi:hypothetical protein